MQAKTPFEKTPSLEIAAYKVMNLIYIKYHQ